MAAPVLASLLLFGGFAIAQKPVDNVSKGKHPNLAAQRFSTQAYEKIILAQLLDQVNSE